MPQWEEELKSLLASLGVSLENTESPDLSLEGAASASIPPTRKLAHMANDADIVQRDLVKQEVQATVTEVTRLTRAGYLDPTLHDDIIRILHALTRPAPASATDAAEWELTTSAAVLRFCRLVLRLTHPA
jgi:hypothetical protein